VSGAPIKCPTCKREIEWERASFRPFCSERCRLVDLGAWFSGQHAIPGESSTTPEDAGAAAPDRDDS